MSIQRNMKVETVSGSVYSIAEDQGSVYMQRWNANTIKVLNGSVTVEDWRRDGEVIELAEWPNVKVGEQMVMFLVPSEEERRRTSVEYVVRTTTEVLRVA